MNYFRQAQELLRRRHALIDRGEEHGDAARDLQKQLQQIGMCYLTADERDELAATAERLNKQRRLRRAQAAQSSPQPPPPHREETL